MSQKMHQLWNGIAQNIRTGSITDNLHENGLTEAYKHYSRLFWTFLPKFIKSNQIKIKKNNLYSAVYSTDSEALGRQIKWGRRNNTGKFFKFSKSMLMFWATDSKLVRFLIHSVEGIYIHCYKQKCTTAESQKLLAVFSKVGDWYLLFTSHHLHSKNYEL